MKTSQEFCACESTALKDTFTYDNHVLDHEKQQQQKHKNTKTQMVLPILTSAEWNGTIGRTYISQWLQFWSAQLVSTVNYITSLHCHWPCVIHLHESASLHIFLSFFFSTLLFQTAFNSFVLFCSRCRCCFRFFDHFIAFFLRFFIIWPCRKHFNRSQRFQMTLFRSGHVLPKGKVVCTSQIELFTCSNCSLWTNKTNSPLILLLHRTMSSSFSIFFCSSLPGRYSFHSKNSFLLKHFYFIFVSFWDHYLGFSI